MPQRIGGVGIYTCDGIETIVGTAKCVHCQTPIDIPNRRKLTEYADICRNCNGFMCLKAACHVCVPWQRKIDEIESSFYRRQQFLRSMGF